MLEIERKFLLKDDSFKQNAVKSYTVIQGYLSSVSERTVRVRIKENKGYITIKGKGNDSGLTRFEWEKEISVMEAEQLLLLCEPVIIEKIRYEVPYGKHIYEIDEFCGDNEGLVIAEIELGSENDSFEKPKWLGKEVTGNEKYYNSYLSKHPFTFKK